AEVARRGDHLHQPQHAARSARRRPDRRAAARCEGRRRRRPRDHWDGARRADDGCRSVRIVGYTDRWTVAPGERVRFMVSTSHDRYRARIARLFHGDPKPDGPGLKVREVADADEHAGREQPYPLGSYGLVDPAPRVGDSFTVSADIFPTTPGAIFDAGGWALYLAEHGDLAFRAGDAI